MVIHDALLVAVHWHPPSTMTLMPPDPPGASNVTAPGSIVAVQLEGACETLCTTPPIATVVERALPVEFADTAYVTLPSPLPLDPVVMVSQESFAVAVQAHAPLVDTA